MLWGSHRMTVLLGREDIADGGLTVSSSLKKRFTFSFLSIEEDFGRERILIWRVEHHSTQDIAGRRTGGFFLAEKALHLPFSIHSRRLRKEEESNWEDDGPNQAVRCVWQRSALHRSSEYAASVIGVRCIGQRTALCFWRQTDACWCAVPFDSGLTAEQGRCREGKRIRSSPSQTEVGTLHPHISHLILARGFAPSHLSYPMQAAAERQWTRGRSCPACKTQRTAFAGAAFCVMHRSTARLRMRCAVRGPED